MLLKHKCDQKKFFKPASTLYECNDSLFIDLDISNDSSHSSNTNFANEVYLSGITLKVD